MSLGTPEKVRKLQRILYAKAKGSPGLRFYSLYDKLYREDILQFCWRLCKQNGGVAGVDNECFEDIEARGVERWLGELSQKLREKRYRPQALKRVYIPKAQGGTRPLSIPTIRDRVVQMAAVLVLSPIFEPDFPDEQYAYRPKRKAHDAIRKIHRMVHEGYCEVVDVDLRGYFDTIPHKELMKSLSRRISDGQMLHVLKMWLTMPVEEEVRNGKITSTNTKRKEKRGIPQGSPVSPLLSNVYMRRFILAWKRFELEEDFGSRIVNYADDFVILCKVGARKAEVKMKEIMSKLRLAVNDEKTQVLRVPDVPLEFLGYNIERCYSPKSGKAYIGTRPSKAKVKGICQRINCITGSNTLLKESDNLIKEINNCIRGWSNYFCLGPVSKSYSLIDSHVRNRLRRWLCRKHKVAGRGTRKYPNELLYDKMGLLRLEKRTCSFPWAKA